MNAVNLEICRQIKDGIDAARKQGVWCGYPDGVWIQDQYHRWPWSIPAQLQADGGLIMADPMAYHQCPICKKPMKRVETENYGPGWVFDCKCLDDIPPQSDAGTDHG